MGPTPAFRSRSKYCLPERAQPNCSRSPVANDPKAIISVFEFPLDPRSCGASGNLDLVPPGTKVSILFGHAKPSSACPFRGCDVEIPPSGKRTIALLRKGMRREVVRHRGCDHHGQPRRQRHPTRFLHRNLHRQKRYASARLIHGTRPFKNGK